MSGVLLISKSSLFLDCVESQIQEKLSGVKPIKIEQLSDIPAKLSNQEFDYIFSDHLSLPLKSQSIKIVGEAKKTKSFIFCENFGDIIPEYREQENLHIISCPYFRESLNFSLSQILQGEPMDQFKWGNGIKEMSLRGDEILFHQGTKEAAIYLVKSGTLSRVAPDGRVVDDGISEGSIIGELTYFESIPKPWSVVAKEDCDLVRIPYNYIDKEIEGLPPWVKAMFSSLAGRALKYSKAS